MEVSLFSAEKQRMRKKLNRQTANAQEAQALNLKKGRAAVMILETGFEIKGRIETDPGLDPVLEVAIIGELTVAIVEIGIGIGIATETDRTTEMKEGPVIYIANEIDETGVHRDQLQGPEATQGMEEKKRNQNVHLLVGIQHVQRLVHRLVPGLDPLRVAKNYTMKHENGRIINVAFDLVRHIG